MINTQGVDWEKVNKIFTPEKESFLKKSKKTLEKYPLAKDVLIITAGLGIVSLALLMPPLAIIVGKEAKRAEKDNFMKRLGRLKQQKFVEIIDKPEGPIVKITENGVKKALQYKLETMALKKPKKWDGLWRMVVFDVPEEKKRARDSFRRYLNNLGFHSLNQSVFVHPFPCFNEVEFLRQICDTGKEVTYIVAKTIESSTDLKKHFGLK